MTQELYVNYAPELQERQRQVFRTEVGSYDKFSRNGQAEDLRTVWHEFNTSSKPLLKKRSLDQEFAGSVMD